MKNLDRDRVVDWAQDFLLHEEAPTRLDATFLGKKEFGSRGVIKRQGACSWVQYERIPILAVSIFLVVFGVALGVLLSMGGQWGLTVPNTAGTLSILGAYVFFIAPAFLGMLVWMNRRYAGRGELLVVTADDETVTLPHDGQTVPWGSLHAVTEVVGWHESHGDSTRIRQIGLIWRVEEGFRQQALLTMSHGSGKLAQQLGALLHVPVLRAKQPLLGKGRGRQRKRA